MPSKVSFKVAGLQELGEALSKLRSDVALKVARSMTGSAAQVVKKEAIRNAPQYEKPHEVDGTLVQPGNLKKNIITKRLTKSSLTSEHIVTVRGKKKDGYASRYGRLVEFGTVKMSPNSFLRKAFDSKVFGLPEVMRATGKRRIEALVAGLKKKGPAS